MNYSPTSLQNGDVISCVVTSSTKCSTSDSATSNTITISIISPVIPTISASIIGGDSTICYSDTTTVFLATTTNAGSTPSYQWMLNGSPILNAVSSSYNATTINNGDVFSCELVSSGTCPQTVKSNEVTMTVTPMASIVSVSDTTFCEGDTVPENVLTSNPPGASYVWTNSDSSIGLAASGTGSVPTFTSTNTGSTPISGTLTVVPSIDGCDGDPSKYTITINPTPEISVSGATLTATIGSTFQWYLDGMPIPNATSQSYNVTASGQYTVVVDGTNCPSIAVPMYTTGITSASSSLDFNLYPNPNNGSFSLSFFSAEKDTYTVQLINALGASVYKKQLVDVSGNYSEYINLTDVAKGVYLLHFSSAKTEVLKKLIVE